MVYKRSKGLARLFSRVDGLILVFRFFNTCATFWAIWKLCPGFSVFTLIPFLKSCSSIQKHMYFQKIMTCKYICNLHSVIHIFWSCKFFLDEIIQFVWFICFRFTMTSFQEVPQTSNFAHVIFQNVAKSYLPNIHLECHYTLTPYIHPHPKDWVGIFKVRKTAYFFHLGTHFFFFKQVDQ